MGCGGVRDYRERDSVGKCVGRLGCLKVDKAGGEVSQEEVGVCINGGAVDKCVGSSLCSCYYFCDGIDELCMLIECAGDKIDRFGYIVGASGM